MTIEQFIQLCDNNILIGLYEAGKERPLEEMEIKGDYYKRQAAISRIKSRYPNASITSFWVYNEDTIAVNVAV